MRKDTNPPERVRNGPDAFIFLYHKGPENTREGAKMTHVSFEEYEAAKAEIIGGVQYKEDSTLEEIGRASCRERV